MKKRRKYFLLGTYLYHPFNFDCVVRDVSEIAIYKVPTYLPIHCCAVDVILSPCQCFHHITRLIVRHLKVLPLTFPLISIMK